MYKIYYLLLLAFLPLISCDNSKYEKLKVQNDSLRHQLNAGMQVVNTIVSVNTLLDSIDATRNIMKVNINDGLKEKGYDKRMLELKDYIKQTEDKLGELEASMIETNVNTESYLIIIDALKDELRIRNEEMGLIEENMELNNDVQMKAVQLGDVESKLDVKRAELMMVEYQIKNLVKRMVISEAEGLYAQAGAMEEAAKRTKLAPHRRKETYREALSLYEKSLAKGKKEAKAKIAELKAKIGPDEN